MKLTILIFILCFSFNLYGKTGSVTGLDIPRFVSLKSDDANIRVGPSVNYPIKLKYVFQNLPLEIIDEFDVSQRLIRVIVPGKRTKKQSNTIYNYCDTDRFLYFAFVIGI